MKKAVVCKECGSAPERGAYCRPCWRKHEYVLHTGSAEGYKPYVKFEPGMDCPDCGRPIKKRHPNFIACHPCGVKRHRVYQREYRGGRNRPANNPIVVNSKTHRAPGQQIAPPAPRIEVKPERVPIPEGMKINRVTLNISRWEHGGADIWNPKL